MDNEFHYFWNKSPNVLNHEPSRPSAIRDGLFNPLSQNTNLVSEQGELFTDEELKQAANEITAKNFATHDLEIAFYLKDAFKTFITEYQEKNFLLSTGENQPYVVLPETPLSPYVECHATQKDLCKIALGEDNLDQSRDFWKKLVEFKKVAAEHQQYIEKDNGQEVFIGNPILISYQNKKISEEYRNSLKKRNPNGDPNVHEYITIQITRYWNTTHGYGKIRPNFYADLKGVYKRYLEDNEEELLTLQDVFLKTCDSGKLSHELIEYQKEGFIQGLAEISTYKHNMPKVCIKVYRFYLYLLELHEHSRNKDYIAFNMKDVITNILPEQTFVDTRKKKNTAANPNIKLRAEAKKEAENLFGSCLLLFWLMIKENKTTGFEFLPVAFRSKEDFIAEYGDEIDTPENKEKDVVLIIKHPSDKDNLKYNSEDIPDLSFMNNTIFA